MTTQAQARPLFDLPIVRRAVVDAFTKLNPRHQVRNPGGKHFCFPTSGSRHDHERSFCMQDSLTLGSVQST